MSIVLHLLAFGAWEGARRIALSRPDALPDWVRNLVTPPVSRPPSDPLLALTPEERKAAEEQIEIPLQFIEVDPAQATPEPPKQAQYTSTDNTAAANPNPPLADARLPRIEGAQENMPRVLDVARTAPPQPAPAPQPAPPTPAKEEAPPSKPAPAVAEVPQPATPAQPQPRPTTPSREPRPAQPEVKEGGSKAGETQLAKVTPNPVVPTPQVPRPPQAPQPSAKPPEPAQEEAAPPRRAIKRLAEAREQKGIIIGEKMKQDGGVRRFALEASVDAKSSPFANYDRQFIYAVQQRWYALLDEHRYSLDRVGKVVLRFKLRSDGTVVDMTQLESNVGEVWSLLCESAIVSQSPFARWPDWMKRMVGKDTREITFTFYYNIN